MRIEPDDGPDVDDFVVVEDGVHRVRIAEVRTSTSAQGDESWMLRLELVNGPLAGRTAVTDWLNFGARGLDRVRRVLSALGYDLSQPLDVDPQELVGQEALVELATRETMSPEGGRMQRRSRVVYDGWSPPDAGAVGAGLDPAAGGGGSGQVAADTMPF